MNYILHTRAAFAQLAAEPAATPHHVSLYVALFQHWNATFFAPSIILVRDELMSAAHLGNRNTYIACLRDLTTWGLITYLPSRSQHKHSRALMHELCELSSDIAEIEEKEELFAHSPDVDLAVDQAVTWSKSGPTSGLSDVQAVDQAACSIYKTSINRANPQLFLNSASGEAKIDSALHCPNELPLEEILPPHRHNEAKEKVAPKRKVRSHTTQERKAKRPEVPFAESELADLSAFIAAFTGTDFELANLRYYHEKVANWRKDGEPPRRRDWKATTKTFMLNDVERNALVLAPGSQRGASGTSPNCTVPSDQAAEYVSQRYS